MPRFAVAEKSVEVEFFPLEMPRGIIARSLEWPENFERAPHYHDCDQLVYCSEGIMDVTTDEGTWVVPPQRAVWMPAKIPHIIHAKTALSFRSIYVDPSAVPWLPKTCCIVNVSPLLRHLILEAVEIPPNYQLGGRDERVMNLILDEIGGITAVTGNLHLPLPKDQRLAPIVEAIRKDPSVSRSRDEWAKLVGASSRTIHRIFRAETGMTFGQWQRQAVLLESIRRLAEGQSVLNVAVDMGYDSPSAFTAMFRRTLGVTPGKYFK